MRHLRIITLLPSPSNYNPNADIIGTTTNPGDSVQIRVNGTTYTVTSDSHGRFSFDIPSGVTPTNLYRFMYEQTNVETVDLTNLDTSSVTDFGDAFNGCTSLETVDTTGIDMGSVTSISNMFDGCSSLTGVTGIDDWDTSSLIYMGITFRNCTSLTSLDLSGWDTDQLTSVSSAFYGCSGLTSLDLSGWDTTGLMSTGNYTYFVPNSSSLSVTCDFNKFDAQIRSTYSNVNWIPVIGNKISGTTVSPNQSITLRVNGTNHVLTSDSNKYFELDVSGITITSLKNLLYSNTNKAKLETIDFDIDSSSCTLIDQMLEGCTNLTSVTFTNFDTSSVTNMSHAFSDCNSLSSLDVSGFNTSNVTDMSFMFAGCGSLASITGIGSLDVENVTTMESMFGSCSSLTGLDLDEWVPSSCATFFYMFTNCTGLIWVTLFDNTTSATNMSGMFNNCSSIQYLSPTRFDTSSVTDMSYMLYGCTSIVEVDLSSFDTTNAVSSMSSYFIPNLSTITAYYNSAKFDSSIVQTYPDVNWVAVHEDYITGTLSYNPGTFKLRINGTDYDCVVDTSTNPITFRWDNPGITITSLANMSTSGYWGAALTSIDFSHLDTSNVTDMSYLLWGYTQSGGIQVNFGPFFDTYNVTNMDYMFTQTTPAMPSIDLTMFDTRNVTDYDMLINNYGALNIYYKGSKWNPNIISSLSSSANWVDVEQ